MREVAGWKGATRSVELLKCTLRTQGADSMAGPQRHLVGWWLRFENALNRGKHFLWPAWHGKHTVACPIKRHKDSFSKGNMWPQLW